MRNKIFWLIRLLEINDCYNFDPIRILWGSIFNLTVWSHLLSLLSGLSLVFLGIVFSHIPNKRSKCSENRIKFTVNNFQYWRHTAGVWDLTVDFSMVRCTITGIIVRRSERCDNDLNVQSTAEFLILTETDLSHNSHAVFNWKALALVCCKNNREIQNTEDSENTAWLPDQPESHFAPPQARSLWKPAGQLNIVEAQTLCHLVLVCFIKIQHLEAFSRSSGNQTSLSASFLHSWTYTTVALHQSYNKRVAIISFRHPWHKMGLIIN